MRLLGNCDMTIDLSHFGANTVQTACGEAHATLSPFVAHSEGWAEKPASDARRASGIDGLIAELERVSEAIGRTKHLVDSAEQLRGHCHALRSAHDKRLDHWRQMDADVRPARPEPPESLLQAETRYHEIMPQAKQAAVELQQLHRRDAALRDQLNRLVLAQAATESDAAIECLKTTIAAAASAMTEIGKQARLIRSKFPQRADEALRLVDGARQLTW